MAVSSGRPPHRLSVAPQVQLPKPVQRLVRAISAGGGRPVVVGGAIRDHLRGQSPKDFDLEVYGITLVALESILEQVGSVHAVGRSFGVLKVHVRADGEEDVVDVALPRRESKSGRGHRGFVVECDPALPFEEAAARRDFTMNAIGYDPAAEAFLDPTGGADDLAAAVLRHVSPAFDEDPLRVLRACQFAARFALEIAPETLDRCRALFGELDALPKERLWEEWKKLLLKARYPSIGLWALVHTGAIELFPELSALRGCPQEAEWHPEGDVWLHTLLVVDEAARLAAALDDDEERLLLLLGALCHDLGKPSTTREEEGRIRSRNHEAAGEPPTRSFLARIGAPLHVIDAVVPLVREHLKPHQLYAERAHLSDAALRRLATRVAIPRLVRVARADFLGRTTADALRGDDVAGAWLLAEAERLQLLDQAPTPLLQGRHLIARGLSPGPAFGPMLQRAFEAQLDGVFSDVEGALGWLTDALAAQNTSDSG